MSAPTVSVILPTHNRAALLPAAMRSVLDQSYRDLELIVVDDASTDNTEAVVRAINDPRVRYVRQLTNCGAAAARNRGIAEARGEFIAFQDSDDEWLPGKLQMQVDRLSSLPKEFAITQGAVRSPGPPEQYFFTDLPSAAKPAAFMPVNNTSFSQAWLVRRAALLDVGPFDEHLSLWEDWELILRLAQKYRIDMDPRAMASISDTPGSITKQAHRRVQCLRTIVSKHTALFETEPKAMASNLYAIARFELLDDRAPAARPMLLRSLRYNPLLARAWVLLFMSLFGTNFVRRFFAWRNAPPKVSSAARSAQ